MSDTPNKQREFTEEQKKFLSNLMCNIAKECDVHLPGALILVAVRDPKIGLTETLHNMDGESLITFLNKLLKMYSVSNLNFRLDL